MYTEINNVNNVNSIRRHGHGDSVTFAGFGIFALLFKAYMMPHTPHAALQVKDSDSAVGS